MLTRFNTYFLFLNIRYSNRTIFFIRCEATDKALFFINNMRMDGLLKKSSPYRQIYSPVRHYKKIVI